MPKGGSSTPLWTGSTRVYDHSAMRRLIHGALFFTLFFTLACGTSPAMDPCRMTPTFTNDVFPMIVMPKCLTCHSTARMGIDRNNAPSDLNFDSYELVMANEAKFADAIVSGREPPPMMGQLTATTETERQL